MSLRSWVKFWKARSISEVSVLPSTTRKFRCESGGLVTCCMRPSALASRALDSQGMSLRSGLGELGTYSDASEKQTGDGANEELC